MARRMPAYTISSPMSLGSGELKIFRLWLTILWENSDFPSMLFSHTKFPIQKYFFDINVLFVNSFSNFLLHILKQIQDWMLAWNYFASRQNDKNFPQNSFSEVIFNTLNHSHSYFSMLCHFKFHFINWVLFSFHFKFHFVNWVLFSLHSTESFFQMG